ncbi:MAG: Asp-tRNA(Asn)/Glu-tRNA(Gln) amidotransferase subunit GatB [Desulfovibrionaceae bacterium]|nr:Asp-tRNA(Asn)/Glu-tRNA(Gln) amidotransferase subunit GatB [Desulfovibrionaceae bacterium]
MRAYEAVIGLEVHVQLATDSKLFCSCHNKFGQQPNTNVCEICLGLPGALPMPNQQAIHYATLVGLATNCHINQSSVFARKNYFYPDLPSGYQISQFDLPLCEHGFLMINVQGQEKKIGITRIHMENDAGKNIHSTTENVSYVDLNRAGTPLVEIVSEPDMRSAEEAVAYLKMLYGIVTYLGVCDGNMEEGSFRCDANVSIRPKGSLTLGTRTELKNVNSFRNVQRAIEVEIARQQDLLDDGDEVIQETRLYDANKNITASMRSKEEAHDYRYFPDPDLLPIEISNETLEKWRQEIPELPRPRMQRFMELTGLPEAEAEILVQNRELADFFETAAKLANPKKVANYILGPMSRIANNNHLDLKPSNWTMSPESLAQLIKIVDKGTISAKIANDIFEDLLTSGETPEAYIESHKLAQISDSSEIEKIVDEIIAKNPKEAADLKGGKTKLVGFFVGQVMRQTKGKANPAVVNDLLKQKLGF